MKIPLIVFLIITLTSCFGASIDINIRHDGSGKIILEYHVSQTLESIGKLDGNANWPVVPVGRADFERMSNRIPGLSLRSVSTSNDFLTRVELDFLNTDALLAFLNGSGSLASFQDYNGKKHLRLTLMEPLEKPVSDEFLSLLREVSSGYEISISVNTSTEANLSVNPPPTGDVQIKVADKGNKVSFSISTADLFKQKDGMYLDIIY